jgi:aryl-alcohol dehydrogenase-like predicted oxidoreductase
MADQSKPKMKSVRLGNSGLKVSEVSSFDLAKSDLIGLPWRDELWSRMGYASLSQLTLPTTGTDEANSFKILDRFAELGGNFVDIADVL